MKKLLTVACWLTAAVLTAAACSGSKQEIEYQSMPYATYKNSIEIEGQWGANAATGANSQYGIGDPFVMRYNGKYYLYPSTMDRAPGIKVFESDDAVNWTYKGFAVAESEPTSVGAYAPEVVYYNGYFYMCQSRAGKGHYIYRSESPISGFTLVSGTGGGGIDDGNLGMGIDGAFYIADDGKAYVLHTSTPAGLKANLINLNEQRITGGENWGAENIDDANLNGWIEGPGIIRRRNTSYLTYTGNHVISKGYRVAYSYAEDFSSFDDFIQPTDNVTLIDTSDEHYGLGHSSNFNGPDLDSIYTAYHNLVGNGPARRYNIDRYFASGSLLSANGVTHRDVAVPVRPAGEVSGGEDLTARSGGWFLQKDSEAYFTAEYNFIFNGGQEIYFGAGGGAEYALTVGDSGLNLVKRHGGATEILASADEAYIPGKLNTVRIENGCGQGYVYLNGRRIMSYTAAEASGGIGYKTADGVQYTAFSNDVFGTSDFEALKNFPAKFPAVSYLKGEMRGYKFSKSELKTHGARVGEKESTELVDGTSALVLNKGDFVKYACDTVGDTYSVVATVTPSSAGARLKITIGDSELNCTVPKTDSSADSVKVLLGTVKCKTGVYTMKVESVSKTAAKILSFETYGDAENKDGVFTALEGNVTVTTDSVTADGSNAKSVAVFGNKGVADFKLSGKVKTQQNPGANLGICFRSDYFSTYPSQPPQSFMGYYVSIGSYLMSLNRYQYNERLLTAASLRDVFSDGQFHAVEITARNNKFTVTVDGQYTLTATDDSAFFSGQIGLFADGGVITLQDFTYTIL